MNWSWLAFFIGVLVGWLLEWLIDYIFWRRKRQALQTEIADLKRRLEGAQERQREFELRAIQSGRDLEACRADLEASRADLEASRADLEAAPPSAGEWDTRAGRVPLDLSAEDEIRLAEFSPVQADEAQVAAGELPAGDAGAPTHTERSGPADDVPQEPRLAREAEQAMQAEQPEPLAAPTPAAIATGPSAEDEDVSAFSAEEAALAMEPPTGPAAGAAAAAAAAAAEAAAAEAEEAVAIEGLDATRAGAAVILPLAAEDEPAPEKQDLTAIEGIGPKIQGLLYEAGIYRFGQLADTPVERVQEILAAAGSRYRMADPSTWPEQARLAADGRWDELQALQDRLSGGRQA